MKDIPETPLLPLSWAQNAALGATMNAANTKRGAWFCVPKTGTITHIWVFTGSVTTPQPIRSCLQTLDANYAPSGNFVGASNYSPAFTPAQNTAYWMPIGEAAVNQGDHIASLVEWESAGGNMVFIHQNGGIGYQSLVYSSGAFAWARQGVTQTGMAIRYSDGTEYPVGNPIKGWATFSYQNGTNPNERGNRFRLPYSARLSGYWHFGQVGASVPFSLNLYDALDNVLFTRTYNGNMVNGSADMKRFQFDSTFILSPDTWYRMTVKNASTVGNFNVREAQYASASLASNVEGGGDFYSTFKGNATGWTDDPTAKTLIVPCINGIDVGSAVAPTATNSIFGSSIISAGGRTT